MPEAVATQQTNLIPVVRSEIYKMLARGFRYPTQKSFESFKNGTFLTDLFDQMTALPHLKPLVAEKREVQERIDKGMEDVSFENFEPDYVGTFDVGFPEPPCPPYEGEYREGVARPSILIEVSEFYKHFGLAMSKEEGTKELPDYICAELEFLHFLCFKEDQAVREEEEELRQGYVLAQRDFVQRHLAQWLPAFCKKVHQSNASPIYVELAAIADEFVRCELAWLEERCTAAMEEVEVG